MNFADKFLKLNLEIVKAELLINNIWSKVYSFYLVEQLVEDSVDESMVVKRLASCPITYFQTNYNFVLINRSLWMDWDSKISMDEPDGSMVK